MSAPLRHDLIPSSCVNTEVIRFNRLLRKRMKIFKKTTIIESDLNRDCFTKHGLHLNTTGKKQIIMKLVDVIEKLSVRDNRPVIKLQWKEKERNLENRDINQIPGKGGQKSPMANQVPNCDNKGTINDLQLRISNRTKMIPKTMTSDFLW